MSTSVFHHLFGKKDGLDFLSIAREKGYLENVPIFVVTNTGGHDKKQTYLELGATKYYVKANNHLDKIIIDIKEKLLAR